MTRDDRVRYAAISSQHLWWFSLLVWLFLESSCAWTNTVPNKFVQQAEPGVTLTALASHLDTYKGKMVILGGVIVEEKRAGGLVWLWVKNRPLDADHEPHRDASRTESESGHYWVVADPQGLPKGYRSWARLTVVGRVSNLVVPKFEVPPDGSKGLEPVLGALYLRGWSYGNRLDDAWEATRDANYMLSDPAPTGLRQGPQGLPAN
jgi:starvation-inducible outer membrane lipoprotein